MRKILIPLLLSTALYADNCCEDEPSWSFGAEWLYFMPSFDQNAYYWDGNSLITAGGTTNLATRFGEEQSYYSAFRVEGSYQFRNPCQAVTLRYTKFSNDYFDSKSAGTSSQVLGLPASQIVSDEDSSVAFDRSYSYYNIEGLFTFYRTSICNFYPELSAGIKFASLNIKEKANYFETDPGLRQFVEPDMSAWAIGPAAEIDGIWAITNCFGISGRFFYGILATQSSSRMVVSQGNTAVTLNNSPKLWHVTNSFDTRLGLSYQSSISCFNIALEGGYELLDEDRFVSRFFIYDNGIQNSFKQDAWSSFTLNGPYLRGRITY